LILQLINYLYLYCIYIYIGITADKLFIPQSKANAGYPCETTLSFSWTSTEGWKFHSAIFPTNIFKCKRQDYI